MIDIKVGKFYRDGEGDKIEIVAQLSSGRFLGLIRKSNYHVDECHEYLNNGKFYKNECDNENINIIGEWKEEFYMYESDGFTDVVDALKNDASDWENYEDLKDLHSCVPSRNAVYKITVERVE